MVKLNQKIVMTVVMIGGLISTRAEVLSAENLSDNQIPISTPLIQDEWIENSKISVLSSSYDDIEFYNFFEENDFIWNNKPICYAVYSVAYTISITGRLIEGSLYCGNKIKDTLEPPLNSLTTQLLKEGKNCSIKLLELLLHYPISFIRPNFDNIHGV